MGLLEGAMIALVFFLLGRFLPGRRKGPKPVEAVCGCKHHHAMHDPQTGKCNAAVAVDRYNGRGVRAGYDYKDCACLRYSGPVPYPEYYASEIATEAGQ